MAGKPLNGKVALITGGARGIGRAIAIKLANAGCNIAVNYFNSSDLAQDLCQEVQQLGVQAKSIQANVADPRSAKALFAEFSSSFNQLDILINNAASGVLKPAMEMSLKHWRWCLETNAYALNILTQLAKDLMPNGSRIIALSSLGASRALPNYAFIGASKAALESLVRSLSLELAPKDISVNTISAGVIDTDSLKYFPNREQLLAEYAKRSLIDAPLQVQDIADVAYLLCLPEAKMIKGQTIFVDAGYSIIG